MSITFNKYADINSIKSKEVICSQNFTWPRSSPVTLFPGQDVSWAKTALIGHGKILPYFLSLITIEDGYFVVGDGHDGLILSSEVACYEETAFFTLSSKQRNPNYEAVGCEIPIKLSEKQFDDVFIGFDGARFNYYHWLCYSLTRSYFAAKAMPATCQIILPDYNSRVWTESLGLSGIAERITFLAPGVYKAKRIHTIWPQTNVPTDILYFDVMHRVFAQIRSRLRTRVGPRNRIFISRSKARDKRIDQLQEKTLLPTLENLGFRVVLLEELTFLEQANLFFNAEIVVGPHGAGLTNMVFGSEELRVLELNRKIEGDSGDLRPWFYMLAATRGQHYGFIDGSTDGFSAERVACGIERLLQS